MLVPGEALMPNITSFRLVFNDKVSPHQVVRVVCETSYIFGFFSLTGGEPITGWKNRRCHNSSSCDTGVPSFFWHRETEGL